MSSVVETSLIIYFNFIKNSSFRQLEKSPYGSERTTELWDLYDLRFRYLVIYVDNLDSYIHMSSHTVDLSVASLCRDGGNICLSLSQGI